MDSQKKRKVAFLPRGKIFLVLPGLHFTMHMGCTQGQKNVRGRGRGWEASEARIIFNYLKFSITYAFLHNCGKTVGGT